MKVENRMKPVEKSEHILTKCLFGIEILKQMHLACRMRLWNEHLKLGGDVNIVDKLNISWGNTIMVPEDVGKWVISEFEGGLLPEEIRNKKYDVIVTNCPYTHLRNLENRRYTSYPKQRDMAQVFVRWGLDHIPEKGVISYNVIEIWLRHKELDGAKETKKLIKDHLYEVVWDDEIEQYSKNDGGNVGTCILCLTNQLIKEQVLVSVNNISIYKNRDILTSGDILQIEIKRNWKIKHSKLILSEHRYCKNKFSIDIAKAWNEWAFKDENIGEYYLMVKKHITRNTQMNFRLVKTSDPKDFLNRYGSSQPKFMKVEKELGVCLLGFLNCKEGSEDVYLKAKVAGHKADKSPGCWEISSKLLVVLDIPDFDYYKSNRPDQFTAYMTWIEQNMKDKDTFLAGIDEQFQKLIGEKS